MVWVGGDLTNPVVLTPCTGQGHLTLEQPTQSSIQHLQESAVQKNQLLNSETDAVSWWEYPIPFSEAQAHR